VPTSSLLAAIVVQPDDLPAGFTPTPQEDDPNDAGDQAALAQCVGGRDTEADVVASVESPDFTENGGSVSSSATSYRSQEDIDADLAIIHSPKINACYEQLVKNEFARELTAGGTVDAVSMTITPGPGSGLPNLAGLVIGSVTATVSGRQATVYVSAALITGPLTEAEVDIENPGQPVPSALYDELTIAVANRAAQG
jgi:hypothetical protein